MLATASRDTFIKLWNVDQNYSLAQDLIGHTDAIRLIIELNNCKIVSCSDDKTIRIWVSKDNSTYHCEKVLKTDSIVYSIAQMQNGNLASASKNEIKLWNLEIYECYLTISEHTDIIFTIIKLSNGMIATGGRDKTVILCDPLYYLKNEEKKEEI